MRTKLVYVLTCALDATYIEQALMSIWSARYHNPDAHIVLIVDDLTNQLLMGKRAEVLEYITEKVVISFEDDNVSMMYRSRFIKTQVRQLVKGDLLFIDCDTIINHSLEELDVLQCEVGAVCESNLPINQFCMPLYQPICENAQKIGWNPDGELFYFSSGVIYAKDTPTTHQLFALWYRYWQEGTEKGVNIDQPSLAKANIDCGHIIQRIDDKWNCIMFTYPRWAKDAYILHFAAFRNMSFLFSKRVLQSIKDKGLTNYIKQYIVHPTESYIPFDSEFYNFTFKDFVRTYQSLYKGVQNYAQYVNNTFIDFVPKSKLYIYAHFFLKKRLYQMAVLMILLAHWYRTKLNGKYKLVENICSK